MRLCVLACVSLFAACAKPLPQSSRPAPNAERVSHVILVTIDGLLPESYVSPDSHGLRIPTLRMMKGIGAYSTGTTSVFPTLTYPSHTSMATGVTPARHGIVTNRTFDPLENDQDGWRWYAEDIKVSPIWNVAEAAGYKTALIHWPVSVGARVTWLVPEFWRAKNENDQKLIRAVSTPGLLEAVTKEHPDFWTRYDPKEIRDDALTDIAIHVLEHGKPSLVLLHLVEVDGAQHKHGLWSREALAAIENSDAQLARIKKSLEQNGLSHNTSVIVASDHGFMNVQAMVKPCTLLRDAGLLTVDGSRVTTWQAATVANTGIAYVYLKDPKDNAIAVRVRQLFAAKASDGSSGIGRIFEAPDLASLGGDPDALLAIEPAAGFHFGSSCFGDYAVPSTYKATHGFDPRRPEMRASLLMMGPNVPKGLIENAKVIDIGPTIATWLGLPLPNREGQALSVRMTDRLRQER